MAYSPRAVLPGDKKLNAQVDALLEREGIRRDRNLDYTCALLDELDRPVATGSCFRDTLRCFAVDGAHRGEGLLNEVMLHLTQVQLTRGNTRLYLYTKTESEAFFRSLGFYTVATVPGKVVFMENRRNGFQNYLNALKGESPAGAAGETGAVVMNANPFTLGHRWLLEEASRRCGLLHVFIVSEDESVFPAGVRERLLREGTADIENLVLHRTGPYLISAGTFPSYFLKEPEAVSRGHAELDAAIFGRIAGGLGITRRFVGEEPFSAVTDIYNRVMGSELPRRGVELTVLPRKAAGGEIISASRVRQLIHDGGIEETERFLPEATWRFLHSPEAEPVIRAIRSSENVIHH